ncbi:MAG: MFS transporter [Lautropia sp.]|nr:MFS transporter [Lautropia sp.]
MSVSVSGASGLDVPVQHATRLLFLIAGFATGAWAALVPAAKERTGLDEGGLGLVLLCLGIGSLMAMPASGALSTRYGCRAVLTVTGILLCLCLPALALASSSWVLGVMLFVMGAMMGVFDCVMNIQAVIVERGADRPLMSGFHGFYSLGGIAGAAGASAVMVAGLSPLGSMLLAAGMMLLMLVTAHRYVLTYGNPAEGPPFALPRGAVLLLGMLCFICFLTEGSMLDWSGVLLRDYHGMSTAQTGFGFAAFSLTMTAARLTGDRMTARIGRRRILVIGALLAAGGILITSWVPIWQMALLGYALVGLGCANIVPVLFTAVGRQTSMPQRVAVPAMSTLGYAGVLAGPAGIGFVAHYSSLRMAFLLVAVMMIGVAISGCRLKV